MRLIGGIVALGCLVIAAPALAFNPYTGLQPADSYAQLGQALRTARAAWPDSPCIGRTYIAFKAPDLPDGELSYYGDPGTAYALDSGCRVYISTTPLDGYWLCALLTHEFGHLAGQEHSTDPESVMDHEVPDDYAPCQGQA